MTRQPSPCSHPRTLPPEEMTLPEAIRHAEERGCGEGACAADHRALARWLRALVALRVDVGTLLADLARPAGDPVALCDRPRCGALATRTDGYVLACDDHATLAAGARDLSYAAPLRALLRATREP